MTKNTARIVSKKVAPKKTAVKKPVKSTVVQSAADEVSIVDIFSLTWQWVKKHGMMVLHWFILTIAIFCILCYLLEVKIKFSHPDRNNTATILTMTQTEYELLRSAEKLVNNDIGKFATVGDALSAFYAESPVSVRDAVIDRLGKVKSLDDFPKALDDVLGRVSVSGGVPHSSPIPDDPVSSDALQTKAKTPPSTVETTQIQQRIFRRR